MQWNQRFWFIVEVRQQISHKMWTETAPTGEHSYFRRMEHAFPMSSQGSEPDVLPELVALPFPVVSPAPLGDTDMDPSEGISEPRRRRRSAEFASIGFAYTTSRKTVLGRVAMPRYVDARRNAPASDGRAGAGPVVGIQLSRGRLR